MYKSLKWYCKKVVGLDAGTRSNPPGKTLIRGFGRRLRWWRVRTSVVALVGSHVVDLFVGLVPRVVGFPLGVVAWGVVADPGETLVLSVVGLLAVGALLFAHVDGSSGVAVGIGVFPFSFSFSRSLILLVATLGFLPDQVDDGSLDLPE